MKMNIMNICECGEKFVYNGKYNCFYCPECTVWADEKCNNVNCKFCKDRPVVPPMEKNETVNVISSSVATSLTRMAVS